MPTLKRIAFDLGLVDQGKLCRLDSLSLVQLVVTIEDELGFHLPLEAIRNDSFASFETLADTIQRAEQTLDLIPERLG